MSARRWIACAPTAIDCNFENVGGEIMDAVYSRLNTFAPDGGVRADLDLQRHAGPVKGPTDFGRVLMRRLLIKGFIVIEYLPRAAEAFAAMTTDGDERRAEMEGPRRGRPGERGRGGGDGCSPATTTASLLVRVSPEP